MRNANGLATGRHPCLWRGEHGQVFAFVATILFGMFLFAAASINIGQPTISSGNLEI